jgi:hypothetical protein
MQSAISQDIPSSRSEEHMQMQYLFAVVFMAAADSIGSVASAGILVLHGPVMTAKPHNCAL